MKRVIVIARESIIDPSTGKKFNDQQLRIINGIYESEPIEVEDDYDANSLILEFEDRLVDYGPCNFEIREID